MPWCYSFCQVSVASGPRLKRVPYPKPQLSQPPPPYLTCADHRQPYSRLGGRDHYTLPYPNPSAYL